MPCLAVLLCLLVAAISSGCNGLLISGISGEVLAGTTSMEPGNDEDPSNLARSGRAWSVGFTINLETEWVRTTTMGTGAGYTRVTLPASGMLPTHEIGSATVNLWIATIMDLPRTPSIRPRVMIGGATGGNGAIREVYIGAGASFHGSGGWGLHLTAGPHGMAVYDKDVGSHAGWGWQARLRVVKLFVPRCDHAVDVFDGETHDLDDGCNVNE
jgi:hypothetical protein